MNSVRKLFTLRTNTRDFKALDTEDKKLVEAGFELAKQYFIDKNKKSNRPEMADLLSMDSQVTKYSQDNRKFMSKLMQACFKAANFDCSAYVNADGDLDMSIVGHNVNRSTAFKEKFAAIIAQVITPVVPAIVSAEFMRTMDIAHIGYGDTARFIAKNNDIFYVTRQAEGILRGSNQRVYNAEITVNPEPYNMETWLDWYTIAAGVFDFGDFVWRIADGFAAFISMSIVQQITSYVTDQAAANSPYFTAGFTDAKFATLTERVRAANGGTHVTGFGALTALAAVLPDPARVQMYADIGAEWTRVGHLTTYMDVDLFRMPQVLLPNTVNTSALFGLPNDVIFFFADNGYRPFKLVFEGDAFTVDLEPSKTPDKEVGVSITTRMGTGFLTGSHFGAITGVTLA